MCLIEYYTYDDYKHWEGDWELIYGQPIAMAPSPLRTHQNLLGMFAYELNKTLKDCEECEVLVEEDYIVYEDTILKPDVSVVCNEDGDFITKAPEIVVEVVSKSSAKRDEKIKFEIYEKENVKYYILAYPDRLIAKIYKNENSEFRKIGDFSKETLKLNDNLNCEVEIDFDNVFKKLRRRK
ncbi:MAG: Uma2 family endonuclease [Nautiliaceae bacterium]|jgi:Uma2 family endonuclease